jgi:predicted secreted Zn-dependent protease
MTTGKKPLLLTHALPNWGIEGGFCNIGPLRRGLFLIFALQKSKKHLALLVSIRWTLFQTPTAAKRETVSGKCMKVIREKIRKNYVMFNTMIFLILLLIFLLYQNYINIL